MGFFGIETKKVSTRGGTQVPSLDLLHKAQCSACPLNKAAGLKHPKMEPTGTDRPLVYILGEAPGKDEDAKGKQFVGKVGKTLRFRLPEDILHKFRWNNTVRCRPPNDRDPTTVEMECCRPSVEKDIEETKPKAIFGFGAIPLQWALGETGITRWAGRRIPIRVGTHSCWYFPMLHPQFINYGRKFDPRHQDEYGSEMEFAFAQHLKKAFAQLDNLPDPDQCIHTVADAKANVTIVTGKNGWQDVEQVCDYLNDLWNEEIVGHDYETNCLRPYLTKAKILTVSLAGEDGAIAFPLFHSLHEWTEQAQIQKVNKHFENFLYRAKCRKISHGLPFEMEWSAYFYGKDVLRAGKWGCSLTQAYVLDERPKTHDLDFVVKENFGFGLKAISNLDRKNLDECPVEEVLEYNGMDAKYHRHLYIVQRERLREEKLFGVYNHTVRRIPTLTLTQMEGVPISQKVVRRFTKKFAGELEIIEADLAELDDVKRFSRKVGHYYSPSAPHDVKKMLRLIGEYDLTTTKEKELSKVDNEAIKLTLDWRHANKILSTYIKPVTEGIKESTLFPDKKIHPLIKTTVTRTLRTSSTDPNVQNWPKRGEKVEIREQVECRDDEYIVALDYAGIQGRNVAMESKDAALMKAFWEGYDIHTDWLERLLKQYSKYAKLKLINDPSKEGKKYRKDKRNNVKNGFVFPSFFGAQPAKVASELGIPEEEGADLQDQFWDAFPGVHKWHERLIKSYYKNGYVTGCGGFRRHAPISLNQLINSPIQTDESVIVMDAMNRISEIDYRLYQPFLMVHDDLSFIWPKKDVEKRAEVVIREMLKIQFEWINVPLEVEMSVGSNWCELHEVGKFASNTWEGGVKLPAKFGALAEPDTWSAGVAWGWDSSGRSKYDEVDI